MSDDRTFVLFVVPSRWAPPKSCATSRFSPDCFAPNKPYVAHFDPAHGTITLRALPIPVIRLVSGVPALSPDGTELAVDTGRGLPRTSNADSRLLADQRRGQGMARPRIWADDGLGAGRAARRVRAQRGIVILNTNTPGGSIQGASRLAVTYQQPGITTCKSASRYPATARQSLPRSYRRPIRWPPAARLVVLCRDRTPDPRRHAPARCRERGRVASALGQFLGQRDRTAPHSQ